MNIYPAIDLLDGKCVRLYQGRYAEAVQVAKDPIETAIKFISEGAKYLHVVDLDAARGNKSKNFQIIKRLCELPILVDMGGGIRNLERVEECFSVGIDKVVIGTAAVENNKFLKEVLKLYPDRAIIGVDALDGHVKTSGWEKDSGIHYIDFIEDLELLGVKYITYTDISKDGTLNGVNIEAIKKIQNSIVCNIIVSGGVKDIEDIIKLKDIDVFGVICGKSIYAGTLSLREAIEITHI